MKESMLQIDSYVSREITRLQSVATLLSASSSLQELSEMSEVELLEKTVVGAYRDPFDDDEWTKEELANEFFVTQLEPAEQDGYQVMRDDATFSCTPFGGTFNLYLRRYLRESEVERYSHNQLWTWFTDRCSEAMDYLITASMESNLVRVTELNRQFGPFFADVGNVVGQGEYIWCTWQGVYGLLDLES